MTRRRVSAGGGKLLAVWTEEGFGFPFEAEEWLAGLRIPHFHFLPLVVDACETSAVRTKFRVQDRGSMSLAGKKFFAGLQVPNNHFAENKFAFLVPFIVGAGEAFAVRAEGPSASDPEPALEDTDDLARLNIPNLHMIRGYLTVLVIFLDATGH